MRIHFFSCTAFSLMHFPRECFRYFAKQIRTMRIYFLNKNFSNRFSCHVPNRRAFPCSQMPAEIYGKDSKIIYARFLGVVLVNFKLALGFEEEGQLIFTFFVPRLFRSSRPEVFLVKRCPENMQQIYRRTPMLKCDFNKAASNCCRVRTVFHFTGRVKFISTHHEHSMLLIVYYDIS